jgi:type I restriction enzyme S subunit
MNTPHMKKALFNKARGAIGQSNINAKELRAFALPLPDKQLQDSFAAELRSINALTARYANGAETAGAVQTALSAEVFA